MSATPELPEAELFTPEFRNNPYPGYTEMRSSAPIHKVETSAGVTTWLVTRYEDVEALLRDPCFVKDYRNALTADELAGMEPQPEELRPLSEMMLSKDPPDHTRLRRLVSKAFTPRFIEGLRPRIQEIANELLDKVEKGSRPEGEPSGQRRMDLIEDYAFPLPITVISEMLGVPKEDRQKFRQWSNTAVSSDMSVEYAETLRSEMRAFTEYLSNLFEDKRAYPADDLTSSLIRAEEEGDKLGEEELLAMVFLLLVAGHETTVNLIGNGALALLTHPDQLQKLKDDPSLMKSAVEEMLRFDGPVQISTDRFAAENVEFRGASISRGDIVLAVLGSADRDESRFTNPQTLDIEREDNRHLAFGKGIHHCLGAPLARLEGEIGFSTLLARVPDLRLDATLEDLDWRPGLLIRGLQRLPVAFG